MQEQYQTSTNLNARARLQRRYSTNKLGRHQWLFSFLPLSADLRFLDCGCGPGCLWRWAGESLVRTWQIVLSDLLPGMISEARQQLSAARQFSGFPVADVAALPFAGQLFDIFLANHMLYHVSHRAGALQEMARVLKVGGRLIAATNGANHLRELRDMVTLTAPEFGSQFVAIDVEFSLENGASQLAPFFDDVQIHRYENNLQVKNADDILAYIFSISSDRSAIDEHSGEELRQALGEQIRREGLISIQSDSGVFVAVRGG